MFKSCEKVRGVVLEVLPMKKGKTGVSFFDGRISNRVPSVRFVEFDSKVRHRRVEYERKETTVTMSKHEIKRRHHDWLVPVRLIPFHLILISSTSVSSNFVSSSM